MADTKPKRLTISYQKYISYLLNVDPQDVKTINKEWFTIPIFKAIVIAIENFVKTNRKIIIDELYEETKQYYPNITYDELDNIHKNFDDWTNIEILKREIKHHYLQTIEGKYLLEDVLVHVKSEGGLTLSNIKSVQNRITNLIYQIEDETTLPSLFNLREDYIEEIERRDKQPLSKRTYGFDFLDNHFRNTGLCNPGEMSLIVSKKGMGKSILSLWMANSIANRPGKIPVLYFSMEMGKYPSLDRMLSIRHGYTGLELYRKNKTEEQFNKIKQHVQQMDNENFFLFEDPHVSIEKMKRYVNAVRRDLHMKNILPSDGYMILFLDLVTMLQDFGKMSAQEVEVTENYLNAFAKEENVHIIQIAQDNENKFRNGKIIFKSPEDIDYYQILDEDIKGGAGIAERCRVVFMMLRRRMLKEKYFPQESEKWATERDLIDLAITKNNAGMGGNLGHYQLAFEANPYVITHFSEHTNTVVKRGR